MLSGFVECVECGGGFCILGHGIYGCGWRHHRGVDVCTSELRVPREDLEGRVLSAIETQILVPEHLAYVAEQALGLVRRAVVGGDAERERAQKRLDEIDHEIENLIRRAAKLGGLGAYERVLDELTTERPRVEAKLVTAPPNVDLGALRGQINEVVGDLRELLAGAPEDGRRALAQLFGERRLRVRPDPERGFALEGFVTLDPNATAPDPANEAGCRLGVVAGTRNAGEAALPLPLAA